MIAKDAIKMLDSGSQSVAVMHKWAKEYRNSSREVMRVLTERFDKTFAEPHEIAEVVKATMTGPLLLHPDPMVGVSGYPTDLIAEHIAYHLYPDAYAMALTVTISDSPPLPSMILVTKTYEELKKESEKFAKLLGGEKQERTSFTLPQEGVPPKKPDDPLPSRFIYMMEESMMETGRLTAHFDEVHKVTIRNLAVQMDLIRTNCAVILTKDFFKGKPFTLNALKGLINKNWKKYECLGAYAISLDFKYPEAERLPGERVYEGYALIVGGTIDAANYALKTYNLAHGKTP